MLAGDFPLNHARADEICLEVQLESQLDQIVEQLNRSNDLAGQLLWIPPNAGLLNPTPGPNTVLEITPETRVTVFAPGIKTGVDIVILADCSGSMSLEDLTDIGDGLPATSGFTGLLNRLTNSTRTIPRMEALRRAVNQLLDMRLRQSGRVSRIAIVSFTHECNNNSIRFPRQGLGMAEIDANAPANIIKDFRDAIGLMRWDDGGGTKIAPALHFAAQLLHNHGRPDNDRLIVLISDGASWKPKGDDDIGREIGGLEDEVSLMDHLHRSMNIHLHAIGISKEEIFRPWFARKHPGREPHVAWIPNHDLLERLVEVGGGDPSRTGDTDVLQEYFSGLGSGVSRQVKAPRPSPLPQLAQAEIDALDAARASLVRLAAVPEGARVDREQLANEILDSYETLNEVAFRLTGDVLFEYRKGYQTLHRALRKEVSDWESFRQFVLDVIISSFNKINDKVIADARARSDRSVKPANYPTPDVVNVACSAEVQDLKLLRNEIAHGELAKAKETIRLGEVYLQAVGVSYIEPGDAARWSEMQLFVLRKFHAVILKFLEAYRDYERYVQRLLRLRMTLVLS
jgi:hypothetical protein